MPSKTAELLLTISCIIGFGMLLWAVSMPPAIMNTDQKIAIAFCVPLMVFGLFKTFVVCLSKELDN